MRYSAVGLINTFVGFGVIVVAMAAGLNAFTSNAAGYIAGLVISFALNSRWTFSGSPAGRRGVARFLVAFVLAYGLNACILKLALLAHWQPIYAQAASVVGYQVTFYMLLRWAVFRASPQSTMPFRVVPISGERLVLHSLLLASSVLPFLAFNAAAGLLDLPNAIGRIGIGLRLLENPDSSQFYQLSFKIIPNMAVDIWGLAIGRLVGAEAAVNWFVAIAIGVFYVSVQSLRRVLFQTDSVVVGAFSVFAIYGLALRWGFINYVFASGLMIFAIARFERQFDRLTPTFAIVQAGLLTFTFLSSIFPVVLYFVYAGTRLLPSIIHHIRHFEIDKLSRILGMHGFGALIVLLLFLLGQTAPPWQQDTNWLLDSKVEAILALFRYYNEPIELGVSALAGISAVGLIWVYPLKFSPGHRNALVALVATFVIMPFLLKGVAFADSRLPGTIAALALGLVQAGDARQGRTSTRFVNGVAAFALLAAVVKPWVVINQIRPALEIARAIPQLFDGIPLNSIFSIIILEEDQGALERFHLHLPLLQLVHGDYFFPEVFRNYFIDFRKSSTLPPDRGNKIGLEESLLCSNITHVAIFALNPNSTEHRFIQILHQHGALSVGRIDREALLPKMSRC